MSSKFTGHRTRFDYAIEATWLLALAAVPIAFSGPDVIVFFLQPKDFILHLAALLILALWVFEWALDGYRPQVDFGSWSAIRRWLGWNPRSWALAAAAGLGVAATISTILSPLPAVSLWGRDFSQLGYELYSVLSFLVIFFAIALRVREPEQVKRILWVIVGAGAVTGLYGISQRYGWDPIGNGEDHVRVFSSFGNPIFFGSYLVMSTVISLGLALDDARKNNRWWLPIIALLIGIQLAALWFTGSRGPWVGVVFGFAAFALLGALTLNRSQAIRGVGVLVTGLLVALVITNLANEPGAAPGRGIGSIVSGITPAAEGLGGRSDIWQGSARLLDSWERQASEPGAIPALRPVFGLGPEMYYYSYPLTANPQSGVIVVSNAHNSPFHTLLELGMAGLAAFAVLAIATLFTGLSFLRNHWRTHGRTNSWANIAMLAIVASLVGRAVEQMVGIARVGDLVPFWALLALVLVLYTIGRDTGRERPAVALSKPTGFAFLPLSIALLVAVSALAIFVTRDFQMLRSGIIATDAFEESAAGNKVEAVRLLNKATELSPNVQQYHVWAGELLIAEARAVSDPNDAIALLDDALDNLQDYQERDPLAYTTQLRIGRARAELTGLGDEARQAELVVGSLITADALPAYPEVQALMAERVLIAGQLSLGLELADRAIEMEGATEAQPLAWFTRGEALRGMGDNDGALRAFETSLERQPGSTFAPTVHRSMALVYDSMGDTGQAAKHIDIAKALEQALPSGS